ncbi:MAG: fumarylacetoacetate hydrolase family protein [Chloroflexota bacterium]|nr:fumarylacetoacetate hydrolase family protein [Chloroflexota bacterium]
MRLVTFIHEGQDRVGVVTGEQVADVTSAAPTMLELIAGGRPALDSVRRNAEHATRYPLNGVRLKAPIPRPSKNILCLGRNYKEHAEEGGAAVPTDPIWFTKPPTSVCGPYDDINLELDVSQKNDWEVELAVVIGRPGRHIPKDQAWDHVHSYSVFNDFSMRDIQARKGNQWFKGKAMERSSPMGPWLITVDEIGVDPKLQVKLRVNGDQKQSSNTELLIFDIPTCIADISQVMTLEPGDIISTGTPSGVGLYRNPPEFLKPGDVMETEIERIGVLRNRITGE